MGLRRVPRPSGAGATRSVQARALLVALALAASSALVLGGPAAALSARPSVSVQQAGADTVSVSGRTLTAHSRVRIERRTATGWTFVTRVRAHRHRYSTMLSLAAGSTATFRVTSNHRSRKFVVSMPARKAPTGATPTTKPPAPTTYDDCGARPLKADGSAWSCTFHDEFDGTALDRTKWSPQTVFATGSPDAYACYRDDPANVHVHNGVLDLTVRELEEPVACGGAIAPTKYVAGMVSTWHLFSQRYGRFEARIRNTATTAPGLHEAFWLWPDDRVKSAEVWPVAGEIDISETYSAHPDLSIPFLHYSADSGGPQPGVNTAWDCQAPRGVWNTYALEWTASRVAIFVNGKLCLDNRSADPAFAKPYIVALTAALGAVGNNAYDGRAPLPATMTVEYVRVWS